MFSLREDVAIRGRVVKPGNRAAAKNLAASFPRP
jgi:hypothetical protein